MNKYKNLKKQFQEFENEMDKVLGELEDKVITLEKVLLKAGIIEDLDLTDVLYRTETDLWSYNFSKKIPIIVNEAKVKP
jgi:hypothetical protein